MPAFAALTLADGAATPVNHTFSPVNVRDGIAKWADRSGGIPVGYPTITASLKEPTNKVGSKNYRETIKVVFPVLEQTSPSTATGIQPAPTKAFDLIANIEFVMPERATTQNRKDILAFVKNLLANSVATAAVQDLDPVYG